MATCSSSAPTWVRAASSWVRTCAKGKLFTVCDLFDSEVADDANSAETGKSYSTLTRSAFEANYLSFHNELPVAIQGPTSIIGSKVAPGSCRFVHIDASHLYEHVRGDIVAVRDLVLPSGILALDDYRAEHTPGVAAAAWEAVAVLGLRLVCVTGSKMYGSWGDPALVRRDCWNGSTAAPTCGTKCNRWPGRT